MTEFIKEFICGCLSGWAQVLTMQPFEIVKVRLANQSLTSPTYHGIIDCIYRIYKQEGPFAFYKGTASPLIGIGALVSLHFGTNSVIKNLLAKYQNSSSSSEINQKNLSIKLIFISGLITGVPSALVVAPVDHMRIKMQTLDSKKYTSSIDVGVKIFKKHGITGLYQGFYPTIISEVIGLAVYFGSYEILTRRFRQNYEEPPSKIVCFFSGGLAGSLSWIFGYPFDYIKTIIQSDDTDKRKYKSAYEAGIVKYKEEGIKTFSKGLGITVLRAFPVNGVGFMAFEYSKYYLDQRIH